VIAVFLPGNFQFFPGGINARQKAPLITKELQMIARAAADIKDSLSRQRSR